MKKPLLWIGAILLILGAMIYIDNEQYTTENDVDDMAFEMFDDEDDVDDMAFEMFDDDDDEDVPFGRSYNEPIVDISAVGMAEEYQNNAIRLEAKLDGKLVRISGLAREIQSTDDGGASMQLVDYPFIDHIVFASGGSRFKESIAKIENLNNELTFFCYFGGNYQGSPVLVDCIFDDVAVEAENRARDLYYSEQRAQDLRYSEEISRQQYSKPNSAVLEADKVVVVEPEKSQNKSTSSKADEASNQSYEIEQYDTTYVNEYKEVEDNYFD